MSGPLGTSGGGAAGVTSVTAGNGITVTGTTTPTIAASLAAGTGVSIAGTTTLTVSATGVNSVSAGTGISVSGSTSLTVTNTGVTSMAGTGVTVSASTGAVTITAPVVAGGTGISVSGSQTTSLSIANTGVTALAGTGISVSAATGSVTVTPTYAAPTALTIGGTVVTGAAASVANSAHVHAMPGSAVAGASAVGDTAATGSATTVALSDHRHSREAFGTPVVVNGQTTSLATGSLTTLARADHVHTVSNVMTLLATQTVSGASVASVTFSSVPSSTYGLFIISYLCYMTNGTGTVNWIDLTFNGDTGSNYASMSWSGQTNAANAALVSAPGNYRPTLSSPGLIYIWRPNASVYKQIWTIGTYNDSTTADVPLAQPGFAAWWKNTAAITSITVQTRGTYYNNGAIFQLYGMPS